MIQTPYSEEFKELLTRRFEPGELIDFLELSVDQIIDAFECEMNAQMDRLLEELYGRA